MVPPSSLLRLVQLALIALSHEIENGHINISPLEKQLLGPQKIGNVSQEITEGIKPKVASFLVSGKQFSLTKYFASAVEQPIQKYYRLTFTSLLDLCDGFCDRHQGVYANIVTDENDSSNVKIYIGGAAGPYKQSLTDRRRDRGIHLRIMSHGQPSVASRSQKKHERLLQSPGIRSNWLVMVSFQRDVASALVNIAHAVMTIVFGAFENSSYIACRPSGLPDCPQSWGLNELGPLGLNGLASYNRIRNGQAKEEATLVHERNVLAGRRCQDTKRQQHYKRLKNGGHIHVNVLETNGIVKRFFITPMTKTDGCHIDITIPRVAGLSFGLQISRSVDIKFDLEPGMDHSHPYALQAQTASISRKLGILILGKYACGRQKGAEFCYWIQCNRSEAISKAERLTWKVYTISGMQEPLETDTKRKSQQAMVIHDWLESGPVSVGDKMTAHTDHLIFYSHTNELKMKPSLVQMIGVHQAIPMPICCASTFCAT